MIRRTHAAALTLLLTAACAGTTDGVETVTPKVRERSRLELDVEARLAELISSLDLPGATAAVVFRDGREFAVSAGVADRERPEVPMPPNARMLAGSTGKAFFAAAAIALRIDGEVDFDDRLSEVVPDAAWLDEVPNAREVTLRDLLLHRSGVPEHVWDPEVVKLVSADSKRTWKPSELVGLLSGREPLGPPRDAFSYADANYVLAMHAIESATGKDLEDVTMERVVGPLGLTNTVPSNRGERLGLVQGHVVLGGQLGAPSRMVTEDGRVAFNTSFEWAGGGWVSTSLDLARFARHFWSGDLYDASYVRDLTHAPKTPQGPGDAYGVATILRETPFGTARGHDGFFPGYLTTVAWFPSQGFAIAVQTNTDDVRALGGRLFHVVLLELAAVAASGD